MLNFCSWSCAEHPCRWCRRASFSGAKRKVKESSNEGGSSDAAMLTSLRASPAKSRTRREDEKKQDEEEEASNRVSPPLQDMEMQDPPGDEGAAHIVVEAREVPALEVVKDPGRAHRGGQDPTRQGGGRVAREPHS